MYWNSLLKLRQPRRCRSAPCEQLRAVSEFRTIIASMSASLAASERVFSLMKRFFGKHAGRDSSLADQLRASLQLAYNHRVVP
jgi:hypothetical protein